MLLMIDNYDSFTYNLVQYFGELGQKVKVVRNDEYTVESLVEMEPEFLVISPGPGTPQQAGITISAIQAFSGTIPILGVCLGHQSIGEAFGGRTIHARQLMHGKTDLVYHDGKGIFDEMPDPFVATRYHSLMVDEETLPACLKPTAHTKSGELMALEHTSEPTIGVQFHPESINTQKGQQLLNNFIRM